jgi:hypothetical protein
LFGNADRLRHHLWVILDEIKRGGSEKGGNGGDRLISELFQWQQSLPEKLAWMAASKFILDAGIRFKLGRAPPSELLTDSNSAARAFGHQV